MDGTNQRDRAWGDASSGASRCYQFLRDRLHGRGPVGSFLVRDGVDASWDNRRRRDRARRHCIRACLERCPDCDGEHVDHGSSRADYHAGGSAPTACGLRFASLCQRWRLNQHVVGELSKMMAGVDMVHVPYRGGAPATTDLLGGQVQVIFSPLPESIEHIRAGKLRPLAVTTATPLEVLPDIPTVGDFLPGYEASGWQGIGAPRNTPAEIIDKLNKEIGVGLADPKIKARIAELGGTVLAGSPADFGKRVSEDVEKWAKVIKFAHIKSD